MSTTLSLLLKCILTFLILKFLYTINFYIIFGNPNGHPSILIILLGIELRRIIPIISPYSWFKGLDILDLILCLLLDPELYIAYIPHIPFIFPRIRTAYDFNHTLFNCLSLRPCRHLIFSISFLTRLPSS